MKKWKKRAIGLLIAALVIGLPIGVFRFWGSPAWASLLVRLQREKFDAAADALLAGENPEAPFGVIEQYVAEGGVVTFDLGAWGIGPATSYWGVYRALSPAGYAIMGDNVDLSPDGGGWSWQDPSGDNKCYTQAVADRWWYWRAWF